MKLKFIEEKAMKVVMLVTTLLVFLFVGSILYTIVKNGWGAMNWEMISSLPGGGFYIGKEGGLLNAIVGSLYIVGASTVLGLAVSIPVVFYLNIYLKKNSKRGSFARLAYDVLFGIPSIVYGAFAFTIMIYLGLKTSLAGGIIVITLLIIPIFIRSMDEIARELPQDMLNASYSLGATRYETIKVVVRQIAPGIATATLLSIGRAIGDAAAVLFTADFPGTAGSHFASGRIFSAEQPYTRSSGKGVCRRFDIDYYCFDIEYPGTDYYEPFLQE